MIGVKETVDFDSREAVDVESAKLHNELLIENAMKAKVEENGDKELENTLQKVD